MTSPRIARGLGRPVLLGVLALAPLTLAQPPAPAPGRAVTVASLLEEMLDRDALARWPDPPYTTGQFSSYDRASVAPDKPGWFANTDFGQYVRGEQNGGRKEWVMMEADGPGALVRWWAGGTTPQTGPPGTVRIYLDGAAEPVFAGTFDTLVTSGRWGRPPFAAVRCLGRNYYLPVPYAKHCKITYDHPPYPETHKTEDQHWYVIEYRTYPRGTPVRTFSAEELARAAPTARRVGRTLLAPANVPPEGVTWRKPVHRRLAPGEALAEVLDGPRAVRRLSVRLDAPDPAQALRSTVLAITCDGEETVWCPVGDFFGSGVGLNPYRDWWRDVDRSGLLTCSWVMPFRRQCRIELKNLGGQPVEATLGAIATGGWTWDDRSMYFHAGWRQQAGIETKKADGTMDWNYVDITGQGVYVGDALAVHNGSAAWWGEGDEKIYVDGEHFPSHFGTGTEDYYGFSYGDLGTFFESPFHAEPRWEGNRRPGFVTVTRTRILDAIPFRRSLKFDMEIWHWEKTKVTYAATTYWYARPGARSNRGPQPEEARRSLAEVAGRPPGLLEAEALRVLRSTGGVVEYQDDPRWSGGRQLWWRDARAGDRLELALPVAKAGTYRLEATTTRAFDYGIFQFSLDDRKLGGPLDLYARQVEVRRAALGVRRLGAGEHVLTAEVVGSNPAARPRHMLGLDCIRLVPPAATQGR